MDQPHTPTYLFDRAFSDVDDLAQQARQWDLDFRQLECGAFRGDLLQFGAGGVHVSDACFRQTLRQRGAPPANMRTVAVPARADLRLEWRGKAVDGNSLMIFPEGAELESVSGPDFHVYTCTMPESFLDSAGDTLEVGAFSRLLNGAEAIRGAPAALKELRALLGGVCDSIRRCSDSLSTTRTNHQLAAVLPNRIVAAVARALGRCPDFSGHRRLSAVAKAETYIANNAADRIGLAEISLAAGVSERTLRYAFTERFGIGPKQFLQNYRLTAVRRGLREADPETTRVADIANAWGFWHMGQFAEDYRQRFGELPSTTISDKPRQTEAEYRSPHAAPSPP